MGAKSGEICFIPLKTEKKLFLLKIKKSKGVQNPFPLFPTPMLMLIFFSILVSCSHFSKLSVVVSTYGSTCPVIRFVYDERSQ